MKEGDVLFEILPVLYKAKWDAKVAERDSRNWSSITPRGWPTNKVVSQK